MIYGAPKKTFSLPEKLELHHISKNLEEGVLKRVCIDLPSKVMRLLSPPNPSQFSLTLESKKLKLKTNFLLPKPSITIINVLKIMSIYYYLL